MKHSPKKTLALTALAGLMAVPCADASALPGGGNGFRYYGDGTLNCVENGWKFSDPSGYAPATHCFGTEPDGGVQNLPAPLAEVDPSLTKEQLVEVENISALNPKNYLGKDTFAYKKLTGNEPISPISKQMTANFQQSNFAFNLWSTGMNAGWGYASNENIPIYSVDSANPHQNYIWVESTDPRATTIPGYKEIMAGKIPFPDWAMKDYGWSGDKSVAIYDKSTGLWRSMFRFLPITGKNEAGEEVQLYTEDGLPRYRYSSGGYILGEKDFAGLGSENYWLTLMGGTSSVVGMANELTQIGVDEIRAGKINHAISITVADYAGGSFPAKMSDGRINQIRAEGSKDLQNAVGQRYRVSKFQSGKIDETLNNKYRTAIEVLRDNGIIKVANDYTIIENESITPETNVDTLAKEKGWNATIRHHATSFKNYLAEGDMLTVTEAPLPYTPKAGQRFTIPEHVDVDLLADNYNLSKFERMVLHAVQDYGAILTDRNAFVHSLNLEPAASYAPYARLGKNVYKEDPEIVAAMAGSNSHTFPWQEVVWIDANFAEFEGDTGVKSTQSKYVMDVKEGEKPTIYIPDSYNEQTYVGQAVYENIHEQTIMPEGVAFHAPWFRAVKHEKNGVVTHRADKSWEFTPSLLAAANPAEAVLSDINLVSYVSSVGGNAYEASKYDLHKNSQGKANLLTIAQQLPLQQAYKNSWNVTLVDKNNPIARTDIAKLAKGESVNVDVMGNDEPYFGAKANLRSSEQSRRDWGEVFLLDGEGNQVKETSSGGLRYRVTSDNLIEVTAQEASEGIAPLVKYVVKVNDSGIAAATSTPGATSAPGVIQTHVYSRSVSVDSESSTPPVEEPEPVPPVEEPEPEPSTPVIEPPVETVPEDPAPVEPQPEPEPEPTNPPVIETPEEPQPTPVEENPAPVDTENPGETSDPEPGTPEETPAEPEPDNSGSEPVEGEGNNEPSETPSPSVGNDESDPEKVSDGDDENKPQPAPSEASQSPSSEQTGDKATPSTVSSQSPSESALAGEKGSSEATPTKQLAEKTLEATPETTPQKTLEAKQEQTKNENTNKANSLAHTGTQTVPFVLIGLGLLAIGATILLRIQKNK